MAISAPAPYPSNELERMARLHGLCVLDTEPEPAFDAITQMASQVCATPIALITLVDGERQWFKSRVGVLNISETPRDVAFCAHTILSDALLQVPDTLGDARFADFPSVSGAHAVRFYAGAPLVLPTGERMGSLCVLDVRPRHLSERQAETLQSLARIVTHTLVMRGDLIAKSLAVRTEHEQLLARTADEMADLYDNAPCGYHSLDTEGRFARINEAALRWLGCTRHEVIGKKRMVDFLTDEGKALFRHNFPRLMAGETIEDLEFDLVSRSGATRRVVASASAIRDAQGVYATTRTVMYDITELQRTRNTLRELAAEQHAMLNTDLIGILKVKDRHVVWANGGAERMLGYGPGELLHRPTRQLYALEEDYRHGGEIASRDMHVGKTFRMQVQSLRKDGQRRWVDVAGTMQAESPDKVLCMLVDISALKHAEEVRVKGLALEAENRQLAEVGRVKGLFLANMSHELRTPLNAVIGYTHLLQAGAVRPDSPKFTHYLGQIGSSGRQLLGLIDTVLNFASAEAGKLALRLESTPLKPLVQTVVETLQTESRQKGVCVDIEVDEALGDVFIDELRVSQIVSHFLSNAIKFSHEGGSVAVRAWTEGVSDLRIEIEDTGVGIAESDVPRLFTPFQQLSEGNTKAYPGAGLGLALARRLVEAHGGTVGVTSRLGVGSVFWAVFPQRQPEAVRRDG